MVKKLRLSQEEEIADLLKREGFKELTEKDIRQEPYKSIYALPECLKVNKITGLDKENDYEPVT